MERLGPGFGAVVHDVDLDRPRRRAGCAASGGALVDHKVLFFRGQGLTDDAQVAFAARLGELTAGHPVAESAPGRAEIYRIDSSDPEFSFSDVWHTDVTFVETPPAASVLRAVTVPDTGGDTSWADTQLAYESLSAPVRRLVDDLVAVHDGNREWGAYLRRRAGRGNVWDGATVTEIPPVEHPVVRIHPETGRKGLFVNPGFTSHLVGVSDAESRGILDLLYAHLTRPEHTIRHRWAPGDVGIWDNRATAHYANNDYTRTRVMARVTSAATAPAGRRRPRTPADALARPTAPPRHPHQGAPMSVTDELLANNQAYAAQFSGPLPLPPSKHVAVLACMDARLDVYRVLGLNEGEAHVIRNAGGVVTEDEVRSLAISQRLLGTKEIILIHHTDCGMLTFTDDGFKESIRSETGVRPPWAAEAFSDVVDDVRQSLARIENSPFIPVKDSVRGFVFDVATGRLDEVDPD